MAFLFFITTANYALADNDNVVLSYHTSVTIEKGKLVEEETIQIQINRKQGDWAAEVEIPFGEQDKLEILEANIINAKNEIVRTLKKKDVVTKNSVSNNVFYENNFVQEFELKWHEYPYIIKYSYRKTTLNFLYVAKWVPVLYKSTPVLFADLKVKIPVDFPVYISYTDSLEHTVEKSESYTIYDWKSSYTNQLKAERYGTNMIENIPSVSIVPKQFSYGQQGSFDSWASYGLWQSNIIEGMDNLSDAEKQNVDLILKGTNNPKEKIEKLYNYMQDNTRYINVAIDEGGMIPFPASYVCANKYGDCKALTIYMKALLKYAGIASYYSLIYAGINPIPIDQSFPSQQFNHVILCIPLEKDTIWLENTSKYNPFNYLGTFTQNRYSLFVDGEKSKLIKTPVLSLEDVSEINKYNFTLNETGTGTLMISKKLNGPEFENYKYYNEVFNSKEKIKQFQEDLSIKNIENPEVKIIQYNRNDPNLIVNAAMTVNDQFKSLGKSIAIIPFDIFTPPKETISPKDHITRINYPVNISDSVIYALEFLSNYNVKLPENTTLKSDYGSFSQQYITDQDMVIVTRQFTLPANEYPTTQYADFSSFIELLKQTQQKSVIILNPK